jgi:hypothetical protein
MVCLQWYLEEIKDTHSKLHLGNVQAPEKLIRLGLAVGSSTFRVASDKAGDFNTL